MAPSGFSLPEIADAVHAGLAAEAARLDTEQAVRGIDALDELSIHPLLQAGLREAGFGVHPEQHYPEAHRQRRRTDSEGRRCDLVLTLEAQPLARPGKEPTLFDPPAPVELHDAFWLEVKVVSQFTIEGPNAGYASHLMADVRQDVRKLSRDPEILAGAILIVLFVADERVADHDLTAWLTRCLDLGLPLGSPCIRKLPITDRLGNGLCAVALYPVWHE